MPDGRPGSTLLHCFAYLDDPQPVPLSTGHVVVDAVLTCPLETPDLTPIVCSLRYKNNNVDVALPIGWYHVLSKVSECKVLPSDTFMTFDTL